MINYPVWLTPKTKDRDPIYCVSEDHLKSLYNLHQYYNMPEEKVKRRPKTIAEYASMLFDTGNEINQLKEELVKLNNVNNELLKESKVLRDRIKTLERKSQKKGSK